MQMLYAVLLSIRANGIPTLSYSSSLLLCALLSGIGFVELTRGLAAMTASFRKSRVKRESISKSTIEVKGIL